jgi:hypothetical protein
MRLMTRFLGLALVILAAFWFAAANADEIVLVDLVLVRLRISLPLLVFASVLGGMALSLFAGFRAERKQRRDALGEPASLSGKADLFDPGMHEFEAPEPDRAEWH